MAAVVVTLVVAMFRTVQAAPPQVLAHYMPWFCAQPRADGGIDWDHWQWFGKGPKHDPDDFLPNGRRDIASVYMPLIGAYNGQDPAVIEYHLLTAKAAGIDGFVADWYGPGTYSDKVFSRMVKGAERYGMKVAICLEEKTFFPEYSGAKSRADVLRTMETQIRHVMDTHAKSASYLRHNGEPVFFIFNFWGEGSLGANQLSPAEVADVLGRFDERILLVRGGADPNYYGIARGCYLWSADGKDRTSFYAATRVPAAEGKIEYLVGGACPGFDDTGIWGWGNGPRFVDRRGTAEYEDNWNEVLRFRVAAVQLITWNDFQEGTTIEPAEEYGFTFLDLTESFVAEYKGRKADVDDNRWPLRLYALRRLVAEFPAERKAEWMKNLDDYARRFADGRRFLMNWRLKRLEASVNKIAE